MKYIINGNTYELSYQELRENYYLYINMTDEEFFSKISEILHFICVVAYLKEVPAYVLLDDEGLVHQLIHILDLNLADEPIIHSDHVKTQIRASFKAICELA